MNKTRVIAFVAGIVAVAAAAWLVFFLPAEDLQPGATGDPAGSGVVAGPDGAGEAAGLAGQAAASQTAGPPPNPPNPSDHDPECENDSCLPLPCESFPTLAVWVTERSDDGVWSAPRLVLDSWKYENPVVYYRDWVIFRDAKAMAALNPDGLPPAEITKAGVALLVWLRSDHGHMTDAPGGGLTAVFSSEDLPGLGGEDFWMSRWVDDAWTEPKNAGESLNSKAADSGICFDSEGKVRYFASTRLGLGDHDENVYVTRVGADGTWSAAERVPGLNSTNADYPYALVDGGATLFLGTRREEKKLTECPFNDIYVARRGADGTFSKPEPLPAAINAAVYDELLHVTADGRRMFFISSRPAK